MKQPSVGVMRCGTEEPPSPTRVVRAGALQATLDAGNLRYIRIGPHEALRAVAFVARSDAWGTYVPQIDGLEVRESPEQFTVTYDAVCRDARQELRYRARIEGRASGSLVFEVDLEPASEWLTNRTGFVVLHAVEGVAGRIAQVEHTDGSREEAAFPDLIMPSQPMFDLRSITHEVAPGTRVRCVMQGEAYEMEDQRNWSDASYKTYFRPLAKRPLPYTLAAGERSRQSVEVSVDGEPGAPAASTAPVEITLGAARDAVLPGLGLAIAPERIAEALGARDLVAALRPASLVCHFDPARGHTRGDVERFAELGAALNAPLWLEAVVPCRDAAGAFTADPAVLRADLDALAAACAGVGFEAVTASPAAYHKSYQPDGDWPLVPALETFYEGVRERFPGARVGGGMHSYFTELNRKPPPPDAIDFLTHTTCPIVHAGDDVSVMESLESLPSIMRSARALAGAKPYCIGPSSIGMRMNPYGAAPAPNPANGRVPMAQRDPRQRGLLNAAWVLGYVAHAARHEVASLVLAAPSGEHGVVYGPAEWAQPWFDEEPAAVVFPAYHVLRGLGAVAPATTRELTSSAPGVVQGLALDTENGTQVWIANLTGESRPVRLPGVSRARVRCVDETSFVQLCCDPAGFDAAGEAALPESFELAAYAVARIDVVA